MSSLWGNSSVLIYSMCVLIRYNKFYGLDANLITVDDYVGKMLKKINKQYSVNYLVIGEGDNIICQSPEKGEKIKEGDTIILYLGWL